MNKQEEKFRALQMTLEKIINIEKETKYKEERKIKLENGLFLDIKKINDRRWIEEFNSKYVSGLAEFKALNPNKTTQEYINNEIEKINNIEAENKKIFNLSDDKFCDWLRNKYPVKFENSDIKNNNLKEHPFFIDQKKYFEPNEFEDYRITLYKQKLNELPIMTDNFKHIYDDSIFKNNNAFLIFTEFINNDVPDPLTDFSFIFQNLKKDNLIHSLKHKEFYNWLLEKEFITNRDYCIIDNNNGFKSLSKCFSSKRSNKYIRLKEKYL